jgi:hypothetical protein
MSRNDFLLVLVDTHSHNIWLQRSVLPYSYYHHTQDTIEFDLHFVLWITVECMRAVALEPLVAVKVALEYLQDVQEAVQVVHPIV